MASGYIKTESISGGGYVSTMIVGPSELPCGSTGGTIRREGSQKQQTQMTGADPWRLYSTEDEPTHLARPDSDENETYCGHRLERYRPQGRVTDPSAFLGRDQFCTDCLYEVLGAQALAMLDDIDPGDE
jgi:hypothetical protein